MTGQERIIPAEHDYELGMKYKDIGEKFSVSYNTVKSWHNGHGWARKGAQKWCNPKSEVKKQLTN